MENIDQGIHRTRSTVIGAERGKTRLLQAACVLLLYLSCPDLPLKARIAVDLRNTNCGVCPVEGVVVVFVVLECLPKRRRAVEAHGTECCKPSDLVCSRYAQEV